MNDKEQITRYFVQMKEIQKLFFIYLEKNDNENEFQNFIKYIQDKKIIEDKQKIKSILYLISKISNHHHRSNNFFNKIEKIVNYFEIKIKQSFSNFELFHIFKGNKRILLSLIDHKIIIPDSSIANLISHGKYEKRKYHEFLYPEFKEFLNLHVELFESNPEEFEKLRRIGENENQICQIIRNDSLDEFISFIEKNNSSLTTHLKPSLFETNTFLLKRRPSLLQYSAFFGSFHIFNYLLKRIDEEYIEDEFDRIYEYDDLYDCYKENLLWLYSIHGCNLQIMQKLKKHGYKPQNNSFFECFIESIKCHHFEISESLQKVVKDDVVSECLKYYNFHHLPDDFIGVYDNYFYDFCKNDYYSIVEVILKNRKGLLNEVTILSYNFCLQRFKIIFLM